jgi:hypothetical protein
MIWRGRPFRRAAALGLCLSVTAMSEPALPSGLWGGEQVMLDVAAGRAVLRLGCAEGEFAIPAALDKDGRFSAAGRFTRFTGGPTTAEAARPAQFDGVLSGDTLVLTVRQGTYVEEHRLARGLQSKVIRCL